MQKERSRDQFVYEQEMHKRREAGEKSGNRQ